MKRVLFTPEVRLYIKALIPTLYELGYFGYLESSRNIANNHTVAQFLESC